MARLAFVLALVAAAMIGSLGPASAVDQPQEDCSCKAKLEQRLSNCNEEENSNMRFVAECETESHHVYEYCMAECAARTPAP